MRGGWTELYQCKKCKDCFTRLRQTGEKGVKPVDIECCGVDATKLCTI